ncbi:hypothetical protein [Sungkyunkwania multivorans]
MAACLAFLSIIVRLVLQQQINQTKRIMEFTNSQKSTRQTMRYAFENMTLTKKESIKIYGGVDEGGCIPDIIIAKPK